VLPLLPLSLLLLVLLLLLLAGNVLIKHEQGAPYGRVAKVSCYSLGHCSLHVGYALRWDVQHAPL
jgi:hypothetical protein